MPAFALCLWIATTLGWWAFAFLPLPARPPEWLEAARYACFGPMDQGLPGAAGLILLVGAPVMLLGTIVALWGPHLGPSVRRLGRRRAGRALIALLALAVGVEAAWVTAKVRAAGRLATALEAAADVAGGLPLDYPRRTAPAPDFTLVDQHGDAIALGRFAGRPVILTFVFAHCRTLCPTLVETLKRARAAGAAGEVLLVTLDPWRDTVSALPTIARQWEVPAGFHVLSSRRVDDVLQVVAAYGVPAERDERTGDVAHPGLVFVIDGAGRLAFTFNNPPAVWVREALDRLAGPDRSRG